MNLIEAVQLYIEQEGGAFSVGETYDSLIALDGSPVPTLEKLRSLWDAHQLTTAIALKKAEIREAREAKLKVTTWRSYQFQTDKDSRVLLDQAFIFVQGGANPPPWKLADNTRMQLSRADFIEMANFAFGEAAIFFDVAFDLLDLVEGLDAIALVEGFDVGSWWTAVEAEKRAEIDEASGAIVD